MSIEAMGTRNTRGCRAAVTRRAARVLASVATAGGVVLLSAGLAHAQQAQPIGMLVASKGEVSITRPSPPPGRAVKVRAGAMEQLFRGDLVKTGPAAKAKLLLRDESMITIAGDTELEITRALFEPAAGRRSTTVRLLHGLARAVVPPIAPHAESRFTVETPTAAIGVRGSEIIIQANEGTLALCVSGACEAGSTDPAVRVVINMKSGQYSIFRPGEDPVGPLPIPPGLLSKLRRLTTLALEAALMGGDSGPPVPKHFRLITPEQFGLPGLFGSLHCDPPPDSIQAILCEEARLRANSLAPHQEIELGTLFHRDPDAIPEERPATAAPIGGGPIF